VDSPFPPLVHIDAARTTSALSDPVRVSLALTILMNWKNYGAEKPCAHASVVSDLGQSLVVSIK
jgi:hypothetical protein